MVDVFGHFLDMGQDLNSGRATTYHGNSLVRGIKALIVSSTVHVRAFEGVQSRDVGEGPVVKLSPPQKKDVCFVFNRLNLASATDFLVLNWKSNLICDRVVDLEFPFPIVFIPLRMFDGVLKPYVPLNMILPSNRYNIVVYLFAARIVLRPRRVVFEQEGKARSWHITGHSWISIFEPNSPDI